MIDAEEGKWAQPQQSSLSKFTLPSADKKNACTAQRLYTNDALSLILFPPITAQLFSTASSFPALSILTIFLGKCQMKNFEDSNIEFFKHQSRTFLFEKCFLEKAFI